MRILYIAPLKDFSGYANAARGYVRALQLAGADVVTRAIRYDRADSGSEYRQTEIEKELASKPLEDIDIVIQHTTPNEMRPVAGKFNIAVAAWETTRIPDYWAERLSQFDIVMTFCDASVLAFVDSGVASPVFKIPHTFDIPSYDLSNVERISSTSGGKSILDERFVFYNISQLSVKKGIDSLIRAYYAAFHGDLSDKVILVLKTYIDMSNRNAEQSKIQSYISNIREAMRLDPDKYPPIMLVTNTLTDEQIKKLHATGNCYVCSSRAEGWCIPAFEALAYGNKLVTTTWGGMGEFAVDENAYPLNNVYPVDYMLEPLIGQMHADPDLYTAKELVAEPSIKSMMDAMSDAYNNGEALAKPDLTKFNYDNVGNQMLGVIVKAYNSAKTAGGVV